MGKAMDLQILTPEGSVLKEEIQALVVPATDGYLGVLPDHAPIITGLQPGMVKYLQGGKNRVLALSGGFMEINNNKITILADSAEKPEEIDKNRARAAWARAKKRLKEKARGLDESRAELALKRSLARLRVADFR